MTWTYTGSIRNAPLWVLSCTEFREGELFVVRRSGKQPIQEGETLELDQDGSVLHHVVIFR